ncbi:hypothetical protein [Paenibacillus segetis]|uniref:DNA-binding protein n=1 Tax=Paenibacillus segetis TaxID=1325360 RepID=A0ABQ1YB74_9BACL|nr:hypothetical protein [Paenibacillus segetis]GGH19580.1 hypothetical protein GCM10008013_16370 [Paenibacillus segetis]
MRLPKGSLYDLYGEDLLVNPDWKWIQPFLVRCEKLEMYEYLKKIAILIMENNKFIPKVFETAESFYELEKLGSAAILYEGIIEVERDIRSERLAICHYRLFQIVLEHNFGSSYVAHRFIPFRARLPKTYSLNGLLLIAENFAALERWEDVEKYAEELRELAQDMYADNRRSYKKSKYRLQHPLVFYYGRALLLKSLSFEYREMYEEAKKWIMGYVDLSWFKGLDEQGRIEVQRFSMYARANLLCIEVKMGNQTVIPQYAAFLQENPDEILEGLITLLISANQHQYSIDETLQLFAIESMDITKMESTDSYYREFFHRHRYCQFCYHYAAYSFYRDHFSEGIKYTLLSLEVAIQMKNNRMMVLCMTLFEKYREHATFDQSIVYDLLCKGVHNNMQEQQPGSLWSFWNSIMAAL